MTRLSKRHKLIGGVLGLVGAAWAVDLLTGGPGPSPASAAPSLPVAAESIALPPDPADLASIIESLGDDRTSRAPRRFDGVERDLFVPTPQMEAALALTSGTRSTPPEPAAVPAAEPIRFDARHELQGVLTGRVPLALIDGRLCPCGTEIDGYRLVELQRDYAVFQRGDSRVTLRVVIAGRPE